MCAQQRLKSDCAVWSESSLSAWRIFASLAIQNAPSEDSDQTARMRSLIWIRRAHMSEGMFPDVAVHQVTTKET